MFFRIWDFLYPHRVEGSTDLCSLFSEAFIPYYSWPLHPYTQRCLQHLPKMSHLLLYLWRLGFQCMSFWGTRIFRWEQSLIMVCMVQNQGVNRAHFFLKALENMFPSLFLASRSNLHSWLTAPFLHLQSQQQRVSPHIISLSPHLLPPSSSFKDTCGYIELTHLVQDNLPISGSLI